MRTKQNSKAAAERERALKSATKTAKPRAGKARKTPKDYKKIKGLNEGNLE